jgi:formylglycine-generating enzyme required for sulfatase activity
MQTQQLGSLEWIAFILAICLLGISCSNNDNNPVDSGATVSNAPASPSPADGAAAQPNSLGLQWSCTPASGETLTYDIYFGTTNPPTTTIATGVSQLTVTQASLSNLTAYYWQVVTKSSKGTSTKGPVWQFTTGIAGMIFVQGQAFEMGSDSIDQYSKPVHAVTVSSFFIGKYEVTQKEWHDVVVWKQASATTPLDPNPSTSKGDSLPVANVSWSDIQTWLGYLNAKEGLTSSSKQYRLPTEAEWEFAARGGTKSKGYKYSGSNTIDDVAWYSMNSGKTIHAIGKKAPNELGIYDMSGNVDEWCYDWYGPYTSTPQTNPTGPSSGEYCTVRGGVYWGPSGWCPVAYRDYDSPNTRIVTGAINIYDIFGFRYVRTQ